MADSIQLTRQVAVKAIVTENFKTQVGNEINRNLQQIDAELQQLEFKVKRAVMDHEKRPSPPTPEDKMQFDTMQQQVEAEKLRLLKLKDEMKAQSQALTELPTGSVVTQFALENSVEVRVGENIFQRLEGAEILVKDGIIQEIRI